MINPADKSNVDNGVTFIQFLWEQAKPELETLKQDAIDQIWEIVFNHTTRPAAFPESITICPRPEPCTPEKLKEDGFKMARVQILNGIESIKQLRKDAPENLKASFTTDIDKLIYSLKKLDDSEQASKANQNKDNSKNRHSTVKSVKDQS